MPRVDLFPARVPIGRVTVGGQSFPVYGAEELLRALRTVQESVNAVESGITALEISNVPSGSIAATNVQNALNELDTEKANAAATTAALAGKAPTVHTHVPGDITGLGSMSTQNANAVAITGGSVTTGTGAIGYSAGNGGTVSQGFAFGKATGVTLNKLMGEITMDNAALASATAVSFLLTNSTISAEDKVCIHHESGGTHGAYTVTPGATSNGSVTITVRNVTAGSLSEAIVLRFMVFKGSLS